MSIFPNTVIQDATNQALQEYPKESCGFVLAGTYAPQANLSPTPETDFEVSPERSRRYILSGELQGVIHSHPQGQDTPSRADMLSQIAVQVPYGIVVLGKALRQPDIGAYQEFFDFGDHILEKPLLGRKWRSGVYDCFALVRAYIYQTHGVKLPDLARPNNWWETDTVQLFAQEIDRYPHFTKVPFDPKLTALREGDVLLMAIRSKAPNHFGIYLGNNVILHHMSNGVSSRRPLNTLQATILHVLRYKL